MSLSNYFTHFLRQNYYTPDILTIKILAYSLANKRINLIRKMKKIIWIGILLMILGIHEVSSQAKKWTLEECINYAVANNIGLQRQRLQTKSAEVDLLKSKMELLPNLNLGSDANLQFGRTVNPDDNSITFEQNLSNQYSMNSSLNVFTGFVTVNTIAANRFMVEAGLESEKIERNRLVVNILSQFYQILYAKGLEDASKMQLDLSERQLFRITKMVETGKEAVSKQFEIESRVSADRLSYIIAQNSTSQAITTMKQTLQLQPGTEFDILLPDLNNMIITDMTFDTDSIYGIASEVLPRLKEITFELKAAKKQYAASKGYLSPYLTAGGSLWTGYYNVIGDNIAQNSFKSQVKSNNSKAVSLTLNVPIFNRYSTGRNIKQAKLKRDDTALRLEQEKNNLYTEIENACLNYNRGKGEFAASVANYEFNKKSFSAVEKKFEAGLVDVTDYTMAKTTLFSAETEAIRTKLQLIIRRLGIQLYSTGEYEGLIMK
jgi:outer membrane protein